ncbi:recQ-mediated genome instability protein 2 isoform X2 [Vidua chalybeata]|uniref:recQ-mediated genome instability protein 2 isoform X2 n=1 Tax=Vidua chalybeata TaxID=81927 RepID=UPI0023A7CD6E|nr:recQ-mediated genome instability protein 2 isoform X2 [Vidua chalybeata]
MRDLTAEITAEIFRRLLLCPVEVTLPLNQCTQPLWSRRWPRAGSRGAAGKIRARKPCVAPGRTRGKYVMVMGVVRSCSPEPILRAIKMTDLSENPIHKNMWNLEVEDLHRVIP